MAVIVSYKALVDNGTLQSIVNCYGSYMMLPTVSYFLSLGKTLDIFRKGEHTKIIRSGDRWDTGVQCRGTSGGGEGRGVVKQCALTIHGCGLVALFHGTRSCE